MFILTSASALIIIEGLIKIAKAAGLRKSYIPMFAVLISLAGALAMLLFHKSPLSEYPNMLALGIMLGLTSLGVHDNIKVMKKPEDQDSMK